MIITEAAFTIHVSHSFIPESWLYFLKFTYTGHWLYYLMHNFFFKGILCNFGIETFPEFLHCRGVGTALCVEGENRDLLGTAFSCKLTEFTSLYSCLVWKLVIKFGGRIFSS